MSFKEMVQGRGESGAASSQQETRLIEGQVFKLASSLGQLKKLVDALGTPRDTVDHRHRIIDLNASIQQLAKSVKERITALHEDRAASSPEQQQKARKLLQDFANILQDYKGTQKIAQERESSCLPRPNPAAPASISGRGRQGGAGAAGDIESGSGAQRDEELEKQALLQQQQQRQAEIMNNAIEFNESLIEERDQGITEIARQIGEVNEMFQDLAVLINDQGVQVQTIDEHITSTAERIKEGSRELVQAERSHRAYRNKCLWIWLVAVVTVSLIIILVFS